MNTTIMQIEIPDDCLDLVTLLVKRLGGDIVQGNGEEDEYITVSPMPENERPGKMLKGLRQREGLTQRELAKAIGVPQSHISEYEKNKRPIPQAKANELANVLHSVPGNFFCREHE